MATDQGQRPYWRGLILRGELAGQYVIDPPCPDKALVEPLLQELRLGELAPITIFVGANNSGKSRLLRGIFGDPQLIEWLKVDSTEAASTQRNKLEVLCASFKAYLTEIAGNIDDSRASLVERQQANRLRVLMPHGWLYRPLLIHLAKQAGPYDALSDFEADPTISWDEMGRPDKPKIHAYLKAIENGLLPRNVSYYLDPVRYYIPMLRGMRPFTPPSPAFALDTTTENEQDAYAQRTVQDYFSTYNWSSGKDDSQGQQAGLAFANRPRIFTGLGIYADMQRRLLSPSQAERDSIRAYEQFLSERFFPGQLVTLTPALHRFDDQGQRISNDVVYLKIGDSEDRPIYDLGDGMQSLIICTYPIITELNAGSLFFIEEPDLCMHPSLQRIFLSVLRQYHRTKGHQFFLTTHSNHLLDLLEDDDLVSIFSFSKIETAEPTRADLPATPGAGAGKALSRFRIRPTSQWDRHILSQLGVRPSATYLANATIWVEGTSDGAYLRAYMEAFIAYLELRGNDAFQNVTRQLKRYKEDRHYAFVEYNGANLVHFNFDEAEASASGGTQASGTNAASLCAQALVIADGDIVGKGDRVGMFTRQLNHRFVVLPVKEIENLIPEQALHRQLEADRSQKQSKHTNQWPSSCESLLYNEYAARDESSDSGAIQGIGDWLETHEFSGYKALSGTLKSADKTRWACQDRGIPRQLRNLIQEYHHGRKNNESQECPPYLPPYLNQDLVWLCVLIFAHIAKLNHDSEVFRELDAFKDWIKIKNNCDHAPPSDSQLLSPDQCNEKTHVSTPALPASGPVWPIPNPATGDSRACLLSHYLEDRKQS